MCRVGCNSIVCAGYAFEPDGNRAQQSLPTKLRSYSPQNAQICWGTKFLSLLERKGENKFTFKKHPSKQTNASWTWRLIKENDTGPTEQRPSAGSKPPGRHNTTQILYTISWNKFTLQFLNCLCTKQGLVLCHLITSCLKQGLPFILLVVVSTRDQEQCGIRSGLHNMLPCSTSITASCTDQLYPHPQEKLQSSWSQKYNLLRPPQLLKMRGEHR